jgi:2',3'-cyclic-nucleotide 2'-phosphodiesterase (5'-nucleotidase family)
MSSHFDLRLIYASDLEEALEDQQTINFAAIVDALDDGTMATLKLSAGDNYIPGPFFNAGGIRSVFRDGDVLNDAYNGLFGLSGAGSYDSLREQPGVVDISIMNMIGFDASVVGNHEFDAGPSAFEDLVAADARGAAGPAGDRYVGALFPYLSSHLDFSGESGLQDLYTNDIVDATAGAPNTLAPAAFFDLDNGAGGTERVAVVGLTTPVLPAITSPGNVQVRGTAGLNRYPTTDAEYEAVTDALALEVQPVIDQAIADGANKVVLVSHLQQYEMESRLAPKLGGIDVVIAGGSGTQATTAADGIAMTNADGNPVFVVSQNGQYSSVGELTLRFDSNGVPSLLDARDIQSDAAGVASVGGDVTTGSAALVADLVEAVRGIVYTNDQEIRGYTDVYLQGNRGFIRTEETNFGNLAADSQLWYARQQDPTIQVSLKNGGGLRAPIGTIGGTAQNPSLEAPEALVAANDGYDKPAGGISLLDLQNTLRFNNNLVRVDTDASGLRTLMEHSVNGSSPTATPGQFPQVSGMRFSFDYHQDFSEEEGQQRLQSLVLVDDAGDITDVIVQDGDLVGDPNRPVSMVTLGFLANNDGDSYPFSQVAHSITDITDVNGDRIYEQDALSDYLGTFHATQATAYNIAETTADQDQRIINIGTGNTNNIELAIDSGVAAADQPMASLDIGGPAEIGAYSPDHQVALATTGGDELALIDLSDLSAPASLGTIQLSGDLQSVAVSGDLVAVAVDGGGDNVPGEVQFLSLSGVGDAATLTDEGSVTVGALPDSLAFNADGSKLVVANEAQSIDITDPVNNDAEGTISVIDTSSYVAGDISGFSVDTIDFTALNGLEAQLNAEGIRINPNAGSVAQDIEPEYVTVLGDRAWVSLQENNAIAEIDLTDNSLTDIWSLGLKDWSAIATDTSNRGEAAGAYGTKNLYGIKMPDGIDAFQTGGGTYIITANEGDDRDGDGDLNEAVRVEDLSEDFGASAENQAYWQSQLGDRLKLSTTEGDLDGDGDIDVAHAFGGRSFSIYDDAGHLVFDSGNQLDEIAKAAGIYDDGRSDDKGMEPEMVLTQAINDSVYAFVALERADHSAIAMYDVTVPEQSTFVQLFTNSTDNANADSGAESWGPEGLVFIPTEASGAGVLMATNEGDDSPLYEGQIDFYSVLETNRPGAPASGNNDLEVAYAFGGRSFSIYDDHGNLVFDSGNQLDEIARAAGIYDDGRSDDKGMEPEMVLTQVINDSVYAFVALERADHSAIAMYDVTEPEHSRFIQLFTNSTDNANADSGAESWGPEGLVFIQTQNNGAGVLMATNEGDDSPLYEGQIDLYNVLLDENRFIGETTALIPEASAADEPHELIDGASGDVDFPYADFKALATVGEVDPHTGMVLSGYPDGQAAWLADADTIRVAYQSESYGRVNANYAYTDHPESYPQVMASGATFTGSKIHTIDYDRAQFADFLNNGDSAAEMFEDSGFLFDTIYNHFGLEVTGRNDDPTDLGAKWGNQTQPDGTLMEFRPSFESQNADWTLQSLCGSHYEPANKFGAGIGFVDDIWLAAEEWSVGNEGAFDPNIIGVSDVIPLMLEEAGLTGEYGAALPGPGHNSITSQDQFETLITLYADSVDADAFFTEVTPFDNSFSAGVTATVPTINGPQTFTWNVTGHGADRAAGTGPHATRNGSGLSFSDVELGAIRSLEVDAPDISASNAIANTAMGLASLAIDIDNGIAYTAPALGSTGYEKLIPLNSGHQDYVVLAAAGYNMYTEPGPLKIYIGQKGVNEDGNAVVEADYNLDGLPHDIDEDGTVTLLSPSEQAAFDRDSFLGRNGLLHGQIYGLALPNSTFAALGLEIDLDAKMQDDYLKDASAPDAFSGRFYPTSYKWEGWDSPEAVVDTEMMHWVDPSEQPAGYSFFNGDTKTEHPAVDPDITKFRYLQNMTQEGALMGFEFSQMLNEIAANDADGNGLPDFLSVDVTRLLGAFDGELTLKTGGKGVASNGQTAAQHIEKGVEKLVSPDGLQWIKGADGDVVIIDEDSGNDWGERKLALVIDSDDMSITDGYFLAQAGGKHNARDTAGATALGGAATYNDDGTPYATSAEFSGTWDVSPLVATNSNGDFFTAADLAGTGYQDIASTIDINDKTLLGVVQARSQSGGAVERNRADAGGQIFQFSLDLPEKQTLSLDDAELPSLSPVYNPGAAINLAANGYKLRSDVLQLDNRANNSNLAGLAAGMELSLMATRDVHVLNPLGALTIDAGRNGLFQLSKNEDEITNLGGAANIINGGVGRDIFLVNEVVANSGLAADLIKDFQPGIDELVVDTVNGPVVFGADAEVSDLRSNPLLAGVDFRFTPDVRTASGKLHAIAGQTSLMGAGLRVARTDADIVSAEVSITGGSALELAGQLPAGVNATMEMNGRKIVLSAASGSLAASDLHRVLSSVRFDGEHGGTVEVTARDADGLVATTTAREFALVQPKATSAMRKAVLNLDSGDVAGGDIALTGVSAKPLQVMGTRSGDTVRLNDTEEGRHRAFGFGGQDTLSAPDGGRLVGGADDDVLIGSATDYASLSAGSGDDVLIGGIANMLVGSAGDDKLHAIGGGNVLLGGSGHDHFVVGAVTAAHGGANVISDFVSGEDKLVLASSGAFDTADSRDGLRVHLNGDHIATLMGVDSADFDATNDLVRQSGGVVPASVLNAISDVNDLNHQITSI